MAENLSRCSDVVSVDMARTQLIGDNAQLEAVCAEFEQGPFLAVDTEFHRENSYWPRLCLVQIATPERDVLIDPLAPDLDLSPLLALLGAGELLKVFHAGRQDMEIFTKIMGEPPAPIFDTQIAAMACGLGDSVSYESLVGSVLERKIDKTSRFTDWTRRPLSSRQLEYARYDVIFLRQLYPVLRERLETLGRMNWIEEETAILQSPDTYANDPALAFRRLKHRSKSASYRAVLAAVASWREQTAQKLNKPRGRILKDEALQDIAMRPPRNMDELGQLRMVPDGFCRSRHGASVLEAVLVALDQPISEAPKAAPPPPRSGSALGDLLRVLLKHVCEEAGIAPRLVAAAGDLDRIATEDQPDTKALSGWRFELFGKKALELKAGKLSIYARDGKIQLKPV